MQWMRIRRILNIVDPEQVVPNSSILEKCESGSESHVVLWHSETGFIVELLDPLMQKKLRIPYAMDPDPTYIKHCGSGAIGAESTNFGPLLRCTVCPGSSDPLQKKYLIYLHQKIRLTPFINYYDTLG